MDALLPVRAAKGGRKAEDTVNNQDRITSIIASPSQSAEHQAKLCPMCGTLNHIRSRECFNCAWRGAFFDGAAALLQAKLLQAELLHTELRSNSWARCLTSWPQRLRAFFRAWTWSTEKSTH